MSAYTLVQLSQELRAVRRMYTEAEEVRAALAEVTTMAAEEELIPGNQGIQDTLEAGAERVALEITTIKKKSCISFREDTQTYFVFLLLLSFVNNNKERKLKCIC